MKHIRRALLSLSAAALVTSAIAQPAISPDLPVMNLDELGVYAVGYAYRGQAEQQFPLGWSGFFEDRTGVACEPFGTQNGERAFLLHCPWRNGTGIAFQQFVIHLPAGATRILLRGATAMRSQNVTNSDGVTFRLNADGIKLFDYHQTNDVWRKFEFDFSAHRGSNLTVRFEVDPGPKNNPSSLGRRIPRCLQRGGMRRGNSMRDTPQLAAVGSVHLTTHSGATANLCWRVIPRPLQPALRHRLLPSPTCGPGKRRK
jgi:hypothetical protein